MVNINLFTSWWEAVPREVTPVTAGNSANRFCERWAHPCCLLPHHQRKFVSLSFNYKKISCPPLKGIFRAVRGVFLSFHSNNSKILLLFNAFIVWFVNLPFDTLFVLSFSQQQIELWQAAFSILNPKDWWLRKLRGVYILLLLILTRFHMWRMKPNQSWLHKINFETILSLLMLVCRDMRLKL